MKKIFSLSFNNNIIEIIANHILELNSHNLNDFSKTAIIFGGKRPALFLNSAIAKKIKSSFFPPTYFTMDSFIDYILNQNLTFTSLNSIDAYYIIYKLTLDLPSLKSLNSSFTKFLSWAKEIFLFIENLDLENIENKNLHPIEKSAEIGYQVPQKINLILENISQIRESFHKYMLETKKFSRGLKYLTATKLCKETNFSQFDNIFFINPFYLHKTEIEIIKNLLSLFPEKIWLFFSGEKKDWSVLQNVEKKLEIEIPDITENKPEPKINIYAGIDTHTQVGIVREILKTIPKENLNSTVIVLPEETKIFPLLAEISSIVDDLNISLGYSVQYSTIFSLLKIIFDAQITRKERYYTKNYLEVLSHPVVQNYIFENDNSITKILIQKIEESLTGEQETNLGGSITIDLDEIETYDEIYTNILKDLNISKKFSQTKLIELTKILHNTFFHSWEKVSSIKDLIETLKNFINQITINTNVLNYSINSQAIKIVLDLCDEISTSLLINAEEKNLFSIDDLYKFFSDLLVSKKISFKGSPLKGLQILGLLETRSLSFDNVIIIDVNETIFPKIKIYEPLIPRDVMLQLGINRLEKEEEIQKYHFKRLINSAKNVHLIYVENNEIERSRFIEEILWEKQKKLNSPIKEEIKIGCFNINFIPQETLIYKNEKIVNYLKKFNFSASSIDTYIKCPLQFYFKYVLRLSEKESISEDIESNEIGNFIHKLLENTFTNYLNKKPIINTKFKKQFYENLEKSFNETFLKRMRSDYYLFKEVLYFLIKKFIDFEQTRVKQVKKILYLEHLFSYVHCTENQNYNFTVKVDRIDLLEDDSLLILDYKTGSKQVTTAKNFLENSNNLIDRIVLKEKINSFQLPIYIKTIIKSFGNKEINASFYFIKERKDKLKLFFDNKISQEDKETTLKLIDSTLSFILNEICDIKQPFVADKSNERICEHCQFNLLCK